MVQYGTGSGYGESAVGVFCILSSRDFVGGWQKLYWHVYDMIFEFGDGLWAPRVGVGLGEVSDCGALYVSSGVMVEWKSGKWQSVGGLCVPEPEREREVKLNSHNVITVSPYVMAWHSRLIENFPHAQLSMVGEKKELLVLVPGEKYPKRREGQGIKVCRTDQRVDELR